MKRLITNYTFNPATRQVTLTDYTTVLLDQYLLITNVTDNIIIYNFANPSLGGTASTNIITLTYNTTSMSAGDRLQILIDIPDVDTQTVTTTAYSNQLIVKTSGGTLLGLTGHNSGNTLQFIQIFDSATVPADGAVPKVSFYITPKSNFSFDLGNYGRPFSTGIVITNSSLGATKQIGSNNCWFDVLYK